MAAFDWSSLINPAVSLGSKVLGDKLAPSTEQQSVNNSKAGLAEQQRQFNIQNQMAQQKTAQSNQIRGSIMPGMYTNLGFSPQQGSQMRDQYMRTAAPQSTPGGSSYGYAPGAANAPGTPGLGSKIGKTAAGIGLGMAPSIISGAMAGIGPGTATGIAGAIGGIGAAGAATLGIGAAAGLGALLWRKSQAHPEANTWVQGEQNPFDKSMAAIDQQKLSPEEAQHAKQQNAQNYLGELQKFASQGGDKLQVAKQAAATFRQWYGDPMQYGVQLPF